MTEPEPADRNHPPRMWLPSLALRFLVLAVFVFVLYEALIGLGDRDLGTGRVWVIVAGIAGLLLLLAIDRLTMLRVSPTGVEATLAKAQVQGLEQVRDLEDQRAAEAAEKQILNADDPAQVQTAVSMAVDLNVARIVERVKAAIRDKRKLYVRYRPDPDGPFTTLTVAPLDIKPGRTPATEANDYLWVHSYEHGHVLSLRLGQVLGVELSEETFEPKDMMAGWKEKPASWNVQREW